MPLTIPLSRVVSVALLAAGLSMGATAATAQNGGSRSLTLKDFDHWNSISGTALAPNGNWVAYTLTPQVGDGEMVFRSTTGGVEHRHPRGFTGRPQLQAGATGGGFNPAPARWSPDSRFAAFLIYPSMAVSEQARKARARPTDQPKNGLGIFNAGTGAIEVIGRVKAFDLPSESGAILIYHLEPDSTATRPDSNGARPQAGGGGQRPDNNRTTGGQQPRTPGTTLVIRDLSTGVEVRIDSVSSYAIDDSAKWLAYVVTTRSAQNDGAFLRSLTRGTVTPLLTGKGSFAGMTFDRSGRQLAFLSDNDEAERPRSRFKLYHGALGAEAVRVQPVANSDSAGTERIVSRNGRVAFTRDGSTLLFGVAAPPRDSIPADSLAEAAVYDLWHWQDPQLQPQQRLQARQQANRSFQAIYRIADRRVIVLGGDSLPQVSVSDDGKLALANTSVRYAIEAMWGEGGTDVYLLNGSTGARTLITERIRSNATLSPEGRYVLWFDDKHWRSYETATGKEQVISQGAGEVAFYQENWDTPSIPPAWGVGGWTTGDRSVLVYDRYDIWELDPTGKSPPKSLTDGVGRASNITFRIVRTDPEERALDSKQPLVLRAFHNHSKQSGFYRDRIGIQQQPEKIVMADVAFGAPQKAKSSETWVVTQSTFREFPNLWTGASLNQLSRISDANPQQREFAWGTAELVEWLSDDKQPLQGILFKPDGFDPSKRYPMVVYFYEKLSDNLHSYVMTLPRNTIQPTWYVSNGYLVFFPDINYGTGYPGPDALKSIVPGVQSLIAKGFVDPGAIATAGQSWGGYQTAFMITRTNIFKAAMAGAPVANMTSAYGGIRWASGLARSFQYERTQSRIGGSLWEYPLRYLENSPLFNADRVETPLLIMHNDNDGAVPWYQGIELFVALRRLGKEVYMVNYNGDEHNPTKRANQADIAAKTMEFFDHHLRGKPKPKWMAEGIPFLDKGRY